MFSATISKRDLLAAGRQKDEINETDPYDKPLGNDKFIDLGKRRSRHPAFRALTKINKLLLEKRRECEEAGLRVEKELPRELCAMLEQFAIMFSKWLAENPDPEKELLGIYFDVLTFLKIAELYDERYATLYETGPSGEFTVKLFCADPSHLLDERFMCGQAAILFSATLTPAGYFTDVLGGGEDCKYIALPSPFPQENLLLLVAGGISTKYNDRDSSLERVADMIYHTAAGKTGNYIAYFPSYRYLADVHTAFGDKYPDLATVRQERSMAEAERDEFLALFESSGKTMVAFCVLGGVFSEGIDLAGDRLVGTVIVGVGLPQINTELDIVRDYNDKTGHGFDFAYRFPGMNKVLQAAGRVIRSAEDRGVVLLIDERFARRYYTELFPEHWKHWQSIRSTKELSEALKKFWQNNPIAPA